MSEEQGTPEWMACRTGQVTASRVADLMAKPSRVTRPAATTTWRN